MKKLLTFLIPRVVACTGAQATEFARWKKVIEVGKITAE